MKQKYHGITGPDIPKIKLTTIIHLTSGKRNRDKLFKLNALLGIV